MTEILLFGARSPLVVEYEETCARAGIRIVAAISLSANDRLLDRRLAMPLDDLSASGLTAPFIACAFMPARRRVLAEMARERGLTAARALIDPTAIIARSARIGDGSYVNAAAVIGGMSFLGEGVVVNRGATLGHHLIVGDYVSIGPGATLASNIRIGAGAMIGAGATILPNTNIEAGAIVAAGAVVRKTVKQGEIAAGNPAKHHKQPQARPARGGEEDE